MDNLINHLHEIFRIHVDETARNRLYGTFNGFSKPILQILYKKQTGIGRKAAAVEIEFAITVAFQSHVG